MNCHTVRRQKRRHGLSGNGRSAPRPTFTSRLANGNHRTVINHGMQAMVGCGRMLHALTVGGRILLDHRTVIDHRMSLDHRTHRRSTGGRGDVVSPSPWQVHSHDACICGGIQLCVSRLVCATQPCKVRLDRVYAHRHSHCQLYKYAHVQYPAHHTTAQFMAAHLHLNHDAPRVTMRMTQSLCTATSYCVIRIVTRTGLLCV